MTDDILHRHYDAGPNCNDDLRHFRFVRYSGIPLGTFPRHEKRRWPTADRVALLCVLACGLIAVLL